MSEPRCQPNFRTCRIILSVLLASGQEKPSRSISKRLLSDIPRREQGKLQAENGWCCSIICFSGLLAYKTKVAWELWSLGPELASTTSFGKKKKKVPNNQKPENIRRDRKFKSHLLSYDPVASFDLTCVLYNYLHFKSVFLKAWSQDLQHQHHVRTC